MESNGGSHGRVERLDLSRQRNAHSNLREIENFSGESWALGSQSEDTGAVQLQVTDRCSRRRCQGYP